MQVLGNVRPDQQREFLLHVIRGDHKRPLVIILPGGALSCVVSLGMLMALVDAGLDPRNLVIYSVSGGYGVALGYAAGCLEKVLPVFLHLAAKGHIGRRAWGLRGFRLNLEELFRILAEGDESLGFPGISLKAIQQHPVTLRTVLTDYEGVNGVIVDGKQDVFNLVRAAMAIPGLREPVLHNGRLVLDGGCTKWSLPVWPAIKGQRPRAVIVLGNQPILGTVPKTWFEQLMLPFALGGLLWSVPPLLRKTIIESYVQEAEGLRRLEKLHTPCIGIVPCAADPRIFPWTENPADLQRAHDAAYAFGANLLGLGPPLV